jgi:YHS domain-containing protein
MHRKKSEVIMSEVTGIAKDPVCGMYVNKTETEETSEFEGQVFYFCCGDCKDKFEAAPMDYLLRDTG